MQLPIRVYKSRLEGKEQSLFIEVDMKAFGHELCMGIRHGLFGSHAQQDVNIDYPLMHGAEGLHRIAEAIDNLADAIKSKNDTR